MVGVAEVLIADRNGEMHIFLDNAGGDHIVTKFIVGRRGEKFETTLPHGSWAWDRAVERARRAVVFI